MPEEGLEPSRGLTPPDFESGASAIPPLRHEDLRRDYNNFFGNLFQTALVFVGSAFGADINPARTQALIASRDPRKVIAVRLMKLGISRFLGRLAGRVLCDGDFSTVALLIFSSRGEIERGNCNDGSSRRNYVAASGMTQFAGICPLDGKVRPAGRLLLWHGRRVVASD